MLVPENGRSQNYPCWYRHLVDMLVPNYVMRLGRVTAVDGRLRFRYRNRLSPTSWCPDDFDGELPEVSPASVGPKFLLDDERIEKAPRDTLSVDSHIPLVCAASLVKSTHLVVEVDCSHVSVILNNSGCTRHVDAVAYLVVAFDDKFVNFSDHMVREEIYVSLLTPMCRQNAGLLALQPVILSLMASASRSELLRKFTVIRHDCATT